MKKTMVAIVAASLALSLSVGAYASDQAQTVIESEENSTSICPKAVCGGLFCNDSHRG